MITNGIEFLDSFLYDIRNEYTGYVDQDSILVFINETALNYVEELLKSKEDVIHDLNSLRVITVGIQTSFPVLSITTPGVLVLPVLSKEGVTSVDADGRIDIPNMLRLNSIGVLKAKPWNNNDVKVTIVTKDMMPIINKKYYRKPDDNNERVYGYFLDELPTHSLMKVTGTWSYYILDYYHYPSKIAYNQLITSYDSNLLNKIKNICVMRFLERIKDERFQNFVSKQQ